jgi:FkbM family methyltransferase
MSRLAKRCLWGFNLGKNTLAQAFKGLGTDLQVLARCSKGQMVFRQAAVHGFKLLVRADEAVGRRIYYGKSFEDDETEFFIRNIRRSDICIDVGANVGYYALLFARLAPSGRVIAFEPVPLNYHLLCLNVLASGADNVVADRVVVGETEKAVDFVVAEDAAFSSLVDTGRQPRKATIQVPMTSLDAYCLRNGIMRVDVLKVDVEGAEARVIEGARGLLERADWRPRIIMLELHEPMLRKHGSCTGKVLHRMEGYGYHPFVLMGERAIPWTSDRQALSENVFFLQNLQRR